MSAVGGKFDWDRVNRENRAWRAARRPPDSEQEELDLAALKQWHRAHAEQPLEIKSKSPKLPKSKGRKGKRRGQKVLLGIYANKNALRRSRRRKQEERQQALLEKKKRDGLL